MKTIVRAEVMGLADRVSALLNKMRKAQFGSAPIVVGVVNLTSKPCLQDIEGSLGVIRAEITATYQEKGAADVSTPSYSDFAFASMSDVAGMCKSCGVGLICLESKPDRAEVARHYQRVLKDQLEIVVAALERIGETYGAMNNFADDGLDSWLDEFRKEAPDMVCWPKDEAKRISDKIKLDLDFS